MKVAWTFLLATLVASAVPAHARTYVVDKSGSGDFTTIQAAIDTVDARVTADTIIVHAGSYAEHLNYRLTEHYPARPAPSVILCPSGPDATTALDCTNPTNVYPEYQTWWLTRGLGFVNRVTAVPMQYGQFPLHWEQCKFFGGYDASSSSCAHGDLADCDFYASTTLLGYHTTFTNLRFHHAPLVTTKLCGSLVYVNCTFTGAPGDTLVKYPYTGEDIGFVGCTFDSGGVGLNAGADMAAPYVVGCRFRDLDIGVLVRRHDISTSITIENCRFDRCGEAVTSLLGPVAMYADTIADCGAGVNVPSPKATIDGLVAQRITGAAVTAVTPAELATQTGYLTLTHGTYEDVGGVAVRIQRDPAPSGSNFVALSGNRFERCDTAAVVIASGMTVTRNVAFASDGPGIVATFTATTGVDSIAYNTLAFNLGDGVVVGASATLPPGLVVARNLSAQNGGAGFRYVSPFAGAFANNDAWQNYGPEYAGLTPNATNLALDPVFCDLVNGDLTLSAGSPFAPGSAFGWAGAYGVGCDTELLDAPPLADATSLTARPNPARGVITFALPGRANAGAIEVLDVQGRRVWRAPIDAGASIVQWRGEREGGARAGAGIYWVRLNRGDAGAQTKRFIWLE